MVTPPDLFPREITLDNFAAMFESGIWRWTLNSFIVAGSVTFFQLLFSSMAGYAFAKKQFPGRNLIFWLYISSMMIPIYAIIVPLYRMVAGLKLLDTYWALILPGLAAPFGTFLMRQYIQSLPSELIDAARIDGCGEWGVYLVSKGGDKPYRLKMRSPSFCNLSALRDMTVGQFLADAVMILGSMDIVLCCVDR